MRWLLLGRPAAVGAEPWRSSPRHFPTLDVWLSSSGDSESASFASPVPSPRRSASAEHGRKAALFPARRQRLRTPLELRAWRASRHLRADGLQLPEVCAGALPQWSGAAAKGEAYKSPLPTLRRPFSQPPCWCSFVRRCLRPAASHARSSTYPTVAWPPPAPHSPGLPPEAEGCWARLSVAGPPDLLGPRSRRPGRPHARWEEPDPERAAPAPASARAVTGE